MATRAMALPVQLPAAHREASSMRSRIPHLGDECSHTSGLSFLSMHWSEEVTPSPMADETPIVCPVCWYHAVERVEGIVLSARPIGGHDLSQVSVYRCAHWHLFALFNQPKAWE